MRNLSTVLIKAIIFLHILGLPEILSAADIGVSGWMAAGDFSLTSKPYMLAEKKASGSLNKAGFGLVFDSKPYTNKFFNIRFNLNVEKTELESDDFTYNESFLNFNFDTAFGFAIVRSPGLRIWAGPELRLGIANGEGEDFTKSGSSRVVGFGLMLGTDVKLSGDYTLSITAGGRLEYYSSAGGFGGQNDLKGHDVYGYLMASFFFLRTESFVDAGNKQGAGNQL